MSHEDAGRLVFIVGMLLTITASATMLLNREHSDSPYAWPRTPAAFKPPTRTTKVLVVLSWLCVLVGLVLIVA